MGRSVVTDMQRLLAKINPATTYRYHLVTRPPIPRASTGDTELSESDETQPTAHGSTGRSCVDRVFGRYRTQEVGGSSPPSSIAEHAGNRPFLLVPDDGYRLVLPT